MEATKHIRSFNRLNGKIVNRKKVIDLLKGLEADTDAGRITYTPEVKELRGYLVKASKKIPHKGTAILKFKPVKLPANKPLSGVDADLLAGLEFIHDDTNIKCETLSGGQNTIYDMINDMVLETMKDKKLFWRKPWTTDLVPPGQTGTNFATKTRYTGINFLMTNFIGPFLFGHNSPYYLTFNQVDQMGGKVKKGAEGLPIFFYTMIFKDQEGNTLKEEETKALKYEEYFAIPIIKYYHVWNAKDITGIDFPKAEPIKVPEKERIETAEKIVKGMPKRPEIKHHAGDRAYYTPGGDYIVMPELFQFKKEQEYYSTLFHELVHSTGAEKRVGRNLTGGKGSKAYAQEELIAELGAAYLCAEAGILYFTLKNTAVYIKGWSKSLTDMLSKDNKFFLKASAEAQKAADFILDQDRSEGPIKAPKKATKPTPKKVSASKKASIEDVANIYGLKPMEGSILYSLRGKEYSEALYESMEENTLRGKILEKLHDKGFLDFYDNKVLSDKGEAFVKAVDGRLQTRKNVKAGADLFPEEAGLSGLPAGFLASDQEVALDNVFTLKGPIGEFLGNLQRYKLVITITGEYGSGKSEFITQLLDAFADADLKPALLDLEKGGMMAKDTQASFDRNVKKSNRHKIAVGGTLEEPKMENLGKLADFFDVVILDSGSKMGEITNEWVDRLRHAHPDTIWVIIFQRNSQGRLRGGASAEFDAPVALETFRPDWSDYKANYVGINKNRGNRTDLQYFIADKKVVEIKKDQPDDTN